MQFIYRRRMSGTKTDELEELMNCPVDKLDEFMAKRVEKSVPVPVSKNSSKALQDFKKSSISEVKNLIQSARRQSLKEMPFLTAYRHKKEVRKLKNNSKTSQENSLNDEKSSESAEGEGRKNSGLDRGFLESGGGERTEEVNLEESVGLKRRKEFEGVRYVNCRFIRF
jgi:hypothetical protein